MSIEIITHNGNVYPKFQSEGNAMQFAKPFFQKIARGYGVDIGPSKKEWAYVDADGVPALIVDPAITPEYDACNLPPGRFDYCVSSHCLEHVSNWVDALDHWHTKLKVGGVVCLYLPHPSQSYWRPYSNRKHIHILAPEYIYDYFKAQGWKNIFVSDVDLNSSFMAIAEK